MQAAQKKTNVALYQQATFKRGQTGSQAEAFDMMIGTDLVSKASMFVLWLGYIDGTYALVSMLISRSSNEGSRSWYSSASLAEVDYYMIS